MKNIFNNQKGTFLVVTLLMVAFFIILFSGLGSVQIYRQKLYKQQSAKHLALYVAEAGVNYVVWRLAHDPNDYNASGVYNYNITGSEFHGVYEIIVTPPSPGSTVVTIQSTGYLTEYPGVKRVIKTRYGKPSLSTYSLLTNEMAWFGGSETVVGKLHSNNIIRMDGSNDSIVSSALTNGFCTSSFGCNDEASCISNAPQCSWVNSGGWKCQCNGVFGAGSGAGLWRFPITPFDFTSLTTDLGALKTASQNADGVYRAASGASGYHVIFKDTGKFDLYRVNTLAAARRQLNDNWSGYINTVKDEISLAGGSQTALLTDANLPANGLIFLEDNVWVHGIIKGRATLVACSFEADPTTTGKNIYIDDNLTYLARDGSNSLGLIGERHVKVTRPAPSTGSKLTVDATMLAKNGHVYRTLYSNNSDRLIIDEIETYGGMISNRQWNWTWLDSGAVVDGFTNTTSIFDPNATYAPPPYFPTTNYHDFISWEESQ